MPVCLVCQPPEARRGRPSFNAFVICDPTGRSFTRQVAEEVLNRWCHLKIRGDAHRKLSLRPCVDQWRSGNRVRFFTSSRYRFRYDRDANASLCRETDGFECAQPDPIPELQCKPVSLSVDMILQGAAVHSHKIFLDNPGEPNVFFGCEPMVPSSHHRELAEREGLQKQTLVDCYIGQYAKVGKTCRDTARDLVALAFPEINIDLRMRGKPWRQTRWKDVCNGGCVGNDTDSSAYSLGVAAQISAHEGGLFENFTRMVRKCLTRFCQGHAPTSSFQKLNLTRRLHLP